MLALVERLDPPQEILHGRIGRHGRAALRQGTAQGPQEHLAVERLLDEVADPAFHRLHGERNVAVAGHHDHRRVFPVSRSWRMRSRPSRPGMRMSVRTQPEARVASRSSCAVPLS